MKDWIIPLFSVVGALLGSVFGHFITWYYNHKQYTKYQREEVWRTIRWSLSQITFTNIKKNKLILEILNSIFYSDFIPKEDKKIIKQIISCTMKVYKD